MARPEPGNSAAATGLLQSVLQKGAPKDQRAEDQKEDQKKSEHAASLEEEYQLLSGKVDDQYQTKVESASKYRVRLSGIVLMNLVSNQGVVDSIDLPTLAYAQPPGGSGGSFGATLRQSEIGFEAFGPTVAGAKTTADLQLDLAGGFPSVPNGINSGLVRLRTATHANGLDKYLGCGRAGCDFLLTELADIVCYAGDSGADLCGEFVELGAADKSGT